MCADAVPIRPIFAVVNDAKHNGPNVRFLKLEYWASVSLFQLVEQCGHGPST